MLQLEARVKGPQPVTPALLPTMLSDDHEVRLDVIKAAVWRNDTETGVRYNATRSRPYRDGEQWRSSGSFGRDDLLTLAKATELTHSWICEQTREAQTRAPTRSSGSDDGV